MLIQNQVGPIATTASIAPGTQAPARAGQLGETIVTELHGRYYEQAYRRNLYWAANQAATATSVALSTTNTGLCISNPAGNTYNLVLLKVGITLSVAPAAIAPIGIQTGYLAAGVVTHTTPLVPASAYIGVGASPTAKADAACTTVGTPAITAMIMGGFTAAALPSASPALIDLEGSIILPPGAWASIYTLTAVTGIFSFMWEEVPQ